MGKPGPWRDGIRKSASGTWEAKFSRHWSRGHRTRKEALEARAHLIAQTRGSKAVRSETVASWAHRWLDEFPRRAESTNKWHTERISLFVEKFGDRPLNDVTVAEAERFARQHPGRVPSLKAMFGDAVKKAKLLPDSPFRHVTTPQREGRRRIVPLTSREIDRLVEIAGELFGDWGEDVFGPLILMAAWTGMRPAELYALEWRDIRPDSVHVRREFRSRTGELVPHTKNYLDRMVPLAPQVVEALERVPRHREFVFTTKRDKGRFQERSQRHYWWPVRDRFTEKLPKDHWLPKRIAEGGDRLALYEATRHFFASELYSRGVALRDIAEMLGHQDEGELARQVYAHRREDLARENVRRVLWS